jgi:hypothetical protein
LFLEPLEDRLVPYVLSGYTWANPNVSVSFMPDGTLISGSYPSNLFAVYNAAYPQATWQHEVARALQVWADVSNLNFHFVADDGSPQGTAGLAQGDSRFGDIRIGGYNMGSGILGIGWNPNSTTTGGDVELNTSSPFLIGSMPDLASIVMHEVGHAIGFNHTLVDPAVMEGGLWGTYAGPYPDDIAGVQAMYGARKPDVFDAAASNDTLGTATALTLSYGGITFQADISSMTDVDYYKVTAPAGTNGALTVSVDASNLSLFDPKVSVYDASGTLLGTASASTYGGLATVTLTGLAAGQTYYLEASGATTDVFGMGAYKLTAQFGGVSAPPIGPDAFEPNNTVASATNFGKVSSLSQTALTLSSATDVDYYTFVAAGRGAYNVSITPTQGSGMLSLTVLNAQQTVLASGQSTSGVVTVPVSLTSGAQYYIKVSSPSASLFAYTLSLGGSSAGGGGNTGGRHKLVAMGVANPDDPVQGDVFYRNAADDPDNPGYATHSLPASDSSPAPTSVAPLAADPSVVAGPPAALPPQDGAGNQPSLAAMLLTLGQQAPSLPAIVTVPPVLTAAPATVSVIVGVAAGQPPLPRAESGGGNDPAGDEDPEAAPAAQRAPQAAPAEPAEPMELVATPIDRPDSAIDPEAQARVGEWSQRQACDACFAEGSWRADLVRLDLPAAVLAAKDSSRAVDAAAAAALAVVLWGSGGVHPAKPGPRKRWRFRM